MKTSAETTLSSSQLTHQQEDFVELQNHCTLCSTKLHFEYDQDDDSKTIWELAECPECGVQSCRKKHVLN